METAQEYQKGDWVVHAYYGVGQIKKIERKAISGEETDYYRIKTADSVYWMPVEQIDSDVLRPLSDRQEMKRAIDALQKPAEEMSSNYKVRQSRIKEVRSRNSPRAIARLVRDLRARRREKGILNSTERSAFRKLKQRLAYEWAVVKGGDPDEVAIELERMLDPNLAAAEEKRRKTQSSASAARKTVLDTKWGAWVKRRTNKISR